jgi:hypothetical protein
VEWELFDKVRSDGGGGEWGGWGGGEGVLLIKEPLHWEYQWEDSCTLWAFNQLL